MYLTTYGVVLYCGTVESLIKDTLNKGHIRKKPPSKGHTLRSQKFHFPTILVSEEKTTSLKDKMPGPKVSFIRGSTVYVMV